MPSNSGPVDTEHRGEAYGGLRLTIFVLSDSVERGASVSVRLALVNDGHRDVTVTFTSSQRFDLLAKDAAGREVFRWSVGKSFAQMMKEVDLEPGSRVEDELVWNGNVPPGAYTIVGMTSRILIEGHTLVLASNPIVVRVQS